MLPNNFSARHKLKTFQQRKSTAFVLKTPALFL
jgi:hypothetical protein